MITRSQSQRQRQNLDSTEQLRSSKQKKTSKKEKRCNPKEDIISSLDDDILIQILSHLHTKDAVKTGILSKRWLYLWSYVPVLNFESYESRENIFGNDFCNFVERTLLFHRRPGVEKFVLRVFDDDFLGYFDYDMRVKWWIVWAVLANVKEMDMNVVGPEPHMFEFKYPLQLYTCSSLQKLSYSCRCTEPPTLRISWPSLKVCRLRCMLNLEFVNNLISGSPLLEFLELSSCAELIGILHIASTCLKNLILECDDSSWFGDHINFSPNNIFLIDAPYLHSLSILGEWSSNIQLGNLSSLVSANIDFSMCTEYAFHLHSHCENYKYMMMKMLERLSHVTELALGPWFVRFLPSLEDEDFSLSLLKCTKLSLRVGKKFPDFPMIIALLHNTCKLESLSIESLKYVGWLELVTKEHKNTGKNYRKSCKKRLASLLPVLKSVKIKHEWHGRDKRVLALLRFILKEACVLEKIVISATNLTDRMRRRLLCFSRSSPYAMILFS